MDKIPDGYNTPEVKNFISKLEGDSTKWLWHAIESANKHFPSADHYVIRGKNDFTEIRIGERKNGAPKGVAFFILSRGKDWVTLGANTRRLNQSYFDNDLPLVINSSENNDLHSIDQWFSKVKNKMQIDNQTIPGSSFKPNDYSEVAEPEQISQSASDIGDSSTPLNQILYGPPGTGKTFATIDEALRILDPKFLAENVHNRASLKNRYDELAATGHISFVTFHQSFSYEDFIEGLRASNDENSGQIRYEIVDGIFKNLCEAAAVKITHKEEAPLDLSGRRIWKMSLGNTQGDDASIYDECITGAYIMLGYGDTIDFSGCTNRKDIEERFQKAGSDVANGDYAVTSVTTFVTRMKTGDLVVVSDGNFKFRAIGEITGDYIFEPQSELSYGYAQKRNVKWLRIYEPSLPYGELLNNRFSQMTLYELRPGSVLNMSKLSALLNASSLNTKPSGTAQAFTIGQTFGSGYKIERVSSELLVLKKPNGKTLPLAMSILTTLAEHVRKGDISIQDISDKKVFEKLPETDLERFLVNGYNNILPPLIERLIGQHFESNSDRYTEVSNTRVLIIDEINRGNISRIFGELITLIEPTKRKGASDALEAVLPYSKDAFSVPSNVYLVGTMNTADRSLSGLDIALRRRFVFKEMPPRPELLDSVEVEGLQIGQMLRSMNDRIEVLLDRDHCLGHAYFIPLIDEPTLEKLTFVFRQQIIPLLQEYFFEDWERIQWVLNDHRKPSAYSFVRQISPGIEVLFGDGVSVSAHHLPWSINEEAFHQIGAYKGIINHQLTEPRITPTSNEDGDDFELQTVSDPN
ncbi:AAA family ATPase [Halothiobacillus sp.]|uniref:AAA family ATPase n=1 Tax=Halothiobacillus sp. TaxID=1891311 RepID=UPI0026087BF0|nr:AAA family ATPase [Halothiobacillus sp.]